MNHILKYCLFNIQILFVTPQVTWYALFCQLPKYNPFNKQWSLNIFNLLSYKINQLKQSLNPLQLYIYFF